MPPSISFLTPAFRELTLKIADIKVLLDHSDIRSKRSIYG